MIYLLPFPLEVVVMLLALGFGLGMLFGWYAHRRHNVERTAELYDEIRLTHYALVKSEQLIEDQQKIIRHQAQVIEEAKGTAMGMRKILQHVFSD